MKDVEYNDACELPKLIHREKDPTGPFQKLNRTNIYRVHVLTFSVPVVVFMSVSKDF